MWPFSKSGSGRVPAQRQRESELAHEQAKESLRETLQDRIEVQEVSRLARRELDKNHISARIAMLLREGQ
jgi:hypothetical protein